MLLNGSVTESTWYGPRPLSLGMSVLAHACMLSVLMGARPITLPKPRSMYDLTIKGREHKLVWYHFKEKLPEVKPANAKADNRLLRAEVKIAKQSIVSSPKNAPKAPQMIWQKAPEIKTDIKFDMPNLVALSLPKPEPPKQFQPPVPQRKVYTPQIQTPAAPVLQPTATKVAEIADPLKQARAVRDFRPPPSRPSVAPPKVEYVDEAPSVGASGMVAKNPLAGMVADTGMGKVYRPFQAPPTPSGGGKAGVSVPVAPAPAVEASGDSPGELNTVVVGLNPGNQMAALPPVSRPAEFSAGPKLNPKGGTGEGNPSALSVPDLTIRSGNIDTRSTIMARNTMPKPIGPANAAETLREAAKYITVDEIGHPSAVRVASAPDSRFDGRTVYMMAIQMPNLTSYVGSWLMWYSERSARPVSTAVITPPVVHRKVDPKYIAAAVSERVEGIVRLTAVINKDGTVGAVELVHGLDDRLDRTAQEAMAKWQFAPAMRNGEPIDVDILVEIPFRLAPRAER
jgi:TonB family protein